ncbi:MAG TPA: aminoglycoside phosphotransferase family protein [Thermomicrobiales bacterium]|nr:aminoglycoside phosphotransferase family protein [Thermomicrobiales bacterium]
MRDAPNVDPADIARTLRDGYGIATRAIRHLPLGLDTDAAVYRAETTGGDALFVKVRTGHRNDAGLALVRALVEHGVSDILAPIPARSGELTTLLSGDPGRSMTLFPFIEGDSAMERGMTPEQWRRFGTALRAVHDFPCPTEIRTRIPASTFALPSAVLVREISGLIGSTSFSSHAAARFAAFWREHQTKIDDILTRALHLGHILSARRFAHVPCHADIHSANILVGDDGRIWLVDWDAPLLAPRERDLIFVIGSRIARTVTPDEEVAFFEGYGPTEIDAEALIYYRYERIIEDIGEFGKSILTDAHASEESRAYEARLAMSLFEPGADIDRAETVVPASQDVRIRPTA